MCLGSVVSDGFMSGGVDIKIRFGGQLSSSIWFNMRYEKAKE